LPKRLLIPACCLCIAISLGVRGAVYAPDAGYYRLLALGQRAAVPAPFSSRILGPAIAGALGRCTGAGVDTGFMMAGVICLIALITFLSALLWSWRAPAAIFAAVFFMPFWADIFHDYYLPDLLHAAILAAMLLLLLFGSVGSALLLLFPAYLTRESTALVAICMVFALWRRTQLSKALIGVAAILAAVLVGRHYSAPDSGTVHGMTGSGYILGKLVWGFSKNVLGLPLWSNTLPECNPIWTTPLPHPLGAIRTIGLCSPSLWGPARLLLAWFGIFGIGPALLLVLWRKMFSTAPPSQTEPPGKIVVFRFCTVYSLTCFLLAPLLGASTDRLVGYGWPVYFVVLPWLLVSACDIRRPRLAWILLLHLLTCWIAWFGFRQQVTSGYLLAGFVTVALNGVTYFFIHTVDNLWI
jgi:hypothetical protein